MYRQSYQRCLAEGKLRVSAGRGLWRLALRQDFTNPARLGLFVGAFTAPVTAALVFTLVPHWTHNGWLLALLGSVESLIAGTTVMAAGRIERMWFKAKVKKAIVGLGKGP
jgi:hypothetical protein